MPASFSQAMASSVPSGSSSTLAPESHSTSSHSGYTQAMEDWSWKASTHSIPPSIQPIIAASNTPYFSPSSSLDDGAPYANSPGASLYIPSLPPPVPNPAYTWDEINRQDSCSGSAFSFQYGDWEGALPNFIQVSVHCPLRSMLCHCRLMVMPLQWLTTSRLHQSTLVVSMPILQP